MIEGLRQEYIELFGSCITNPNNVGDVKEFVAELLGGQARYTDVSIVTHVPWFVIGLIHGMECGFSFNEHLHNGDPLSHRTVNVPAGRPKTGNPPFSFLESAIDALQYDKFTTNTDWSIAGICFMLESYNGWGYRKHGINSPYLWSYSNHYERGKYVSDGHWDANAVSQQCGAITALKSMVDQNIVALDASPV